MKFTHGRKAIEKTIRGLDGFTMPEIIDTRDNRIALTVDEDTLDGIFMACEEASESGSRWDNVLSAIRSYRDYKKAQWTVATYEHPQRVAAIKDAFAGKKG